MIWHELKELLNTYPAYTIFEREPSVKLHSVMYMAPMFTEYTDEILYLAEYEDFVKKTIPADANLSVLLYCESTPDRALLSQVAANVLCIYDREQFMECANFLQIFYSRVQSMDEWLKDLYEKMHRGLSLTEVINLIAARYQKPVNVVDSSYSVIAASSDVAEYDPRLAGDQDRGYVPPDIIKHIDIRAKRGNKLPHEPILLEDWENGNFVHYNTPILVDGVAIGAFSVFMDPDDTMPFEHYWFLPHIAQILSIFLQKKHFFLKNADNYCSGLLESLFMNPNPALIDIESRMAAFGHELYEYKYVVAVNISNMTSASLTYLASSIQNILEHSIYTTIESHLVFLKSSRDQDAVLNDLKTVEMIRNLSGNIPSLRVGISSGFTYLSESKNALDQARAALEIGSVYEPAMNVYLYDDYRLECMVYRLSETTNISLYCYPQLYSLLEYDKQHQTQLLYTLFVYVFCSENKSISYMCKKLNIHKNTLYFRLNKAKELTGLDFDKPSVSTMVIFTFALMRLNNQITWSQFDI